MIHGTNFSYDRMLFNREWRENCEGIIVPALEATEEHADAIQNAFDLTYKMGLSDMFARAERVREETWLRDPKIFRVYLFRGYDMIETHANSRFEAPDFSDVPDKLEQFSNQDITRLLDSIMGSREELLDLRDLERKLARWEAITECR